MIMKNVKNNFSMYCNGIYNKLIENMNIIGNIRSSNCKVHEDANKVGYKMGPGRVTPLEGAYFTFNLIGLFAYVVSENRFAQGCWQCT